MKVSIEGPVGERIEKVGNLAHSEGREEAKQALCH